MKLLTKTIEAQLRKNAKLQSEATAKGECIDFKPVVKFFGGGAFTWLITELDEDGDTLFGLADLGQGTPELGYISLQELSEIRFPPFRLPVERDRWFTADKTIGEYADEARDKGRIAA